jgi:V8-like Glu-specific endopeptidase
MRMTWVGMAKRPIDRDRRPAGRAWQALGVAVICAAMAGCAARPPAPRPQPPEAVPNWQAAIGSLEIAGSPQICTAVLVRADLIVTASHCLHPDGIAVAPAKLIFTSSSRPQDRAEGVAIFGQGGEVTPGTIHKDQAQLDWALVRISPPLAAIRPIRVAPLSAAQARAEIVKGARFYSAGYGQGAKDRLRPHERCGLLPPDPEGLTEGDLFFATNCIVRLGDSGGPVAIVNGDDPELIGLTVGFTQHPTTGDSIGIVVSAKAFAPYVGGGLISSTESPAPGSLP